jgi:hypothetical protein
MAIKRIPIVLLAVMLLAAGCGLEEGVIQKAPRSYLWFTGNTNGVTVIIEGRPPFELNVDSTGGEKTQDQSTDASKKVYYEIDPGKHTVIIHKYGQVVVNRTLLLGDGAITEIKIP